MNTHLPSMGFLVAFLSVVLFGLAEQAHAQAGQTQATAPSTVLRAGDILRVNVWPNTELSGEFTIEQDGYVYLPLLAEVRAVDDLRGELRRRYGETQRNSVVTVTPVPGLGDPSGPATRDAHDHAPHLGP